MTPEEKSPIRSSEGQQGSLTEDVRDRGKPASQGLGAQRMTDSVDSWLGTRHPYNLQKQMKALWYELNNRLKTYETQIQGIERTCFQAVKELAKQQGQNKQEITDLEKVKLVLVAECKEVAKESKTCPTSERDTGHTRDDGQEPSEGAELN
ncbi:hypothetical protein UY3_01623 [Chelonia mydas]|uniref:Uncharacterized protein n=1 Tax=Chelonia mydas TaxID=8469 RepID=M7BV89_CHEMY|nr:hypothetical protein UY3_01623 [Chelonia mydas]